MSTSEAAKSGGATPSLSSAPCTPGIFSLAPSSPRSVTKSSVGGRSANHGGGASSGMVTEIDARPSVAVALSKSTFKCNRCALTLALGKQDPHRPGQCKLDSLSYKSLQDRWSRNRSLKTWWENKSPEEQTAWFQRQQNLKPGQKRSFSDVEYSDESSTVAFDNIARIEAWITYEEFEMPKLVRGMTIADIEAEFLRIVDSCKADCRWENNQWLIPKFKGLQRLTGMGTEQRNKVARYALVESAEDLRTLQSSGSRLISEFSSGIVPVKVVENIAPAVSFVALETDQPRSRASTDVMAMACHREVYDSSPLDPYDMIEGLIEARGTPPRPLP